VSQLDPERTKSIAEIQAQVEEKREHSSEAEEEEESSGSASSHDDDDEEVELDSEIEADSQEVSEEKEADEEAARVLPMLVMDMSKKSCKIGSSGFVIH